MIVFLHYLRVLAAVMVVMDHVPNNAVPGSLNWYMIHVVKAFSISAVPLFIMASGLLLLNPQKQLDLGTFYKKRLFRIGPAIVFWTFALVRLPYVAIEPFPGIKQLAIDIFHGRPVIHLWYLYMIVSLYFFTPFLRKVVQNCSRKELLTVTLAVNALIFIKVGLGVSTGFFVFEFLYYLGYFFMGYLLFVFMKSEHIRHPKVITIFILLALSVVTFVETHQIDVLLLSRARLSLPIFVIAVSLFALFMIHEHKFKKSSFMQTLDGLGLGIYIIHPVFVKYFLFTYPRIKVDSLAKFFLVTAAGWFMAMCSAFAIKKIPYFRNTV